MTWLLIPYKSIQTLTTSKALRWNISQQILSTIPTALVSFGCSDGCVASVLPIGAGSALLTTWSAEDHMAIDPFEEQKLVAIWCEPEESTVLSIPDEELPHVLERVANLAVRLWGGIALPESWRAKKVENEYSIFASTRLSDLRLAYRIRTIKGMEYLGIGTAYYAYRQQKSIKVPNLNQSDIKHLPEIIVRPEIFEDAHQNENFDPEGGRSDDPDVLMNRGRGEDRHLFSMSYSEWMEKGSPLTGQQRRIIKDKKCPLRIHGPGGSGKTLVIILKALGLLSDALATGRACKVLFILHNNEVRTNVRAAIEAIDEAGFLASSKTDNQFLDVETLHGWCMRELEIDTGRLEYALHADPIVSKARQDEILSRVLESEIAERLPKNRPLLSVDLISHLEGPRERLISNIRYEIAIRIKGRGLRDSRQLYVDSPLHSFVGRRESGHDRYFLFKISEQYELELQKAGRLDTDDVVLSMQSRLSAPLWNRQRTVDGYDYVFVDETHLFNENERRVLPYLTRGAKGSIPIVMTFDEAQSIGGRRAIELEEIGIHKSEQRRLSYVHRCSPEIYRLARDLVERSTLMFTEFSGGEAVARMSEKDMKKCRQPTIVFADGDDGVATSVAKMANALRSKNYQRVGIISFHSILIETIGKLLGGPLAAQILRDRGDSIAGRPLPGVFIMSAENCGGLEFDAVILAGVDHGKVPPSLKNISPEGHMAAMEEACKELYTSVTRARYHVAFVCDRRNGASDFVQPWIESGLVHEG